MGLLLKIFKEESEFTMQELEKIAMERGEDIDFHEQFWINSDIFRTNFQLIVKTMSKSVSNGGVANQRVVNNVWKNEDLVNALFNSSQIADGETTEEMEAAKITKKAKKTRTGRKGVNRKKRKSNQAQRKNSKERPVPVDRVKVDFLSNRSEEE